MNFPIIYKNGNFEVKIEKDGTKTRFTKDDIFRPDRPETIDMNISNYCENSCPYCYINASKEGKHGELIKDSKLVSYINSIPEYTELAINYAEHPDLEEFLIKLSENNIIVNITINQIDLMKNYERIIDFQKRKLIFGIGISVLKLSAELIDIIHHLENVVFHIIIGVSSLKMLHNMPSDYKILLLGYKTKGRGENVIPDIKQYKKNLFWVIRKFNIVSFDNLALNQLDIKNYITKDIWEESYMGEDGQYSFYIDTVEKKYYKSSLDCVGYLIGNKTIKEMFNHVKNS